MKWKCMNPDKTCNDKEWFLVESGQHLFRIDEDWQDKTCVLYDVRVRPNTFIGEFESLIKSKVAAEKLAKKRLGKAGAM